MTPRAASDQEAELLRSVGLEPEADRRRRQGRIAGVLFLLGAVLWIPSALLVNPAPPEVAYVAGVLSALAGALCLVAPWERMSLVWLHLATVLAIVLIGVVNGTSERPYPIYYAMPLVFSAYAFRDRRATVIHFALVVAALFGAIAYGQESNERALGSALIAASILAVAVLTVVHLRERLEASRRSYTLLAEEAIRLSLRIRGPRRSETTPGELAEKAALERLEQIAAALHEARESDRTPSFRSGPGSAAAPEP